MTDEEKVARAICAEECAEMGDPPCWTLPGDFMTEDYGCDCVAHARFACAAIDPARIRQAALEEAAGEVHKWFPCATIDEPRYAAGKALITAIRALGGVQ